MTRRTFLGAAAGAALPAPARPRINSARVFGVRPGSPLLFSVAATGTRPIRFHASGLPPGAVLDPVAGRLSGSVGRPGTYRIALRAENVSGRAEQSFKLVVGEEIALTPVMGCNTWGGWGPGVTGENIRAAADAMVRLGLADHGYHYINIDDGWQGRRGGKYNAIQPNEKFGDMKRLCDYLHGLGLKAGTYSTPWISSWAGFPGGSSDSPDGAWPGPGAGLRRYGRYSFEEADARQWAEWGFDYCKYDWNDRGPERIAKARKMAQALRASGRDMVYEISSDSPFDQAEAFTAVANMCRTTGDIVDVWSRDQLDSDKRRWALGVRDVWSIHKQWRRFNRPGHWNMPCPLRVGLLGGWDQKPLQPTRLTRDEQFTHISLWCLWSAPLIIGCPVERLDAFTLDLLTNDEVLELDQDPLGRQADQFASEGGEVLVKELEGGDLAVGLFNPQDRAIEVAASWNQLGIRGPRYVRDLWRRENLGKAADHVASAVPPHGVALYRLRSMP